MKRITHQFELEDIDSPSYTSRILTIMEHLAKEPKLGCGFPPQVFHYPEGSVKVEWSRENA